MDKKERFWKEIARDFLAIGSWIFYVLVVARALIGPYRPFFDQVIIAGFVLIILAFVIRKYDGYVARAIVLAFFTSLFYEDNLFTGFAVLAGLGSVGSSYYLNKDWKRILLGILAGLLGILIGYYGALLSF